jgi:hypothetical protein
LEWTANAIQNTWLQIIVKANANTGLTTPQTFYIGHAMAEVNGVAAYRVTGADLSAVQAGISNTVVSVNDVRDVNKDRRITGADLSFVQARISNTVLLNNITIPAAGSNNEGSAGSGGGGGGGGGGSAPAPAPEVGAPPVSTPTSQLTGGQGLFSNGLVNSSESTPLIPQGSGTVSAGSTFASSSPSSSESKTSVDEGQGAVDELFAGLGKEDLGKFFS